MPKNFRNAAASMKSVYGTVIGSAQDTQNAQEVQAEQLPLSISEPQPAPHTQGRKGEKLPRINMAFAPQNLEYLRIMAGLRGQSVTRYVNTLVEQDMIQNKTAYDAARKLAGDV